ncbi:MAG: NAD(P)/FAD-dependent oxidoreductase [Salinirussus sp.]
MRIAVLGAGYAGLALTRDLETRLPQTDELILVDERDAHLIQHKIHRVIRQPAVAEELEVPLETVLDRAQHRQAHVEAVDLDTGEVDLDHGTLEYDIGAVALGARTDFHGLDAVREHGMPLKRTEHAKRIRSATLDVIDGGGGRIVVGGAGLSGVQAAGELAALATDHDAESDLSIVLVEQADRVAPTFPHRFGRAIESALREREVSIETGRAVVGATGDTLRLETGDEIDYDTLVWTGGIAGGSALDGERPEVAARLRLGERSLGLGDAVRVVDADGTAAPASAQTAIDQAAVAATNIVRLADHYRNDGQGFEPSLSTYRYDPSGWLVTVGDETVAMLGPTVVTGLAAKAIKAGVGERYRRSIGASRGLTAAFG